MAATNFPTELAGRQDSQYFSVVREDSSIKFESEGGYTTTRPRTTRVARRLYTTGFTDISQAEFDILETFIQQVNTFTEFNWTDPTTQESIEVRFTKPPAMKYKGFGGNNRYNVQAIELKEV